MQPASVPQPTFPEKVGKYELLLPIGTGGMATVYLARTLEGVSAGRLVALKLVHAHLRADKESKLHLLEEAKLAAAIQHPNVIRVLEIDEDPFGVFLVMDYVAGESLSGLLGLAREARLTTPWRLIARILNDALLGLHAAHELKDGKGRALSLVHRDFSPQNILVSMNGETQLGDFGVAKAADRAVRTKTGLTKGKIAYMSPEQARGHAVDRRCDVWAAGVLAWELIARQRLYRSDDDVATLLSIVTEQPPRLSHVLPQIPKILDEAVSSALQPVLENRCPTAEEFRARLEKAWAAADGMADADELAQFMQRVVGPELEARNERITHVKSLRQRPWQNSFTHSSNGSSNDYPQSGPSSQEASSDTKASAGVDSLPAASGAGLQLVETRSDLPSAPSPRSTPEAVTSAADLLRSPAELTEDSVTVQALYAAGVRGAANDRAVGEPVSLRAAALPHTELTETSAVVPTFRTTNRRNRNVAGAVVAATALLALVWATSIGHNDAKDRDAEQTQNSDESAQQSHAATEPATGNVGTKTATKSEQESVKSAVTEPGTLPRDQGDLGNGEANADAVSRTSSHEQAPSKAGSSAARANKGARNSGSRSASKAKVTEGPAAAPAPATKHVGRDKPKLATSPYAGSKSAE